MRIGHPRPPSPFDLFIRSRVGVVRSDKQVLSTKDDSMNNKIGQISSKKIDRNEKEHLEQRKVSLLEQIVRSHPIWYLPYIGRSAAVHLLRPMEQGAFIVRSSSKSNAMALSIRLPSDFDADIDHYLIESIADRTVRLESSPNNFKSLPLLIEHYCLNGEELQTCLALPAVIASCRTSVQLQSIALMGQEEILTISQKFDRKRREDCKQMSSLTCIALFTYKI
ncbi:unnamed protein product [Dracunculus medinensis]|uniref:SH2 domain-containing protein n=1 Tax=Dracunculus medinensis TaxID=318479 RepID=A0A0N4U0N7_DRAME|nr:unnamed protein product [Dracunculus medinensis]